MSSPHPGFDKPYQQKPSRAGSQLLPLAPILPTHQQGSATMTRLANTSQGGRIQVRSSTNPTITDSSMMASLLSTGQGNPQPTISSSSPPSTRKRKLPLDESVSSRKIMRDTHDNIKRRKQYRYAECAALISFMQGNGALISDFEHWRTRLPVVPLQNYLKTRNLDTSNEAEDLFKLLQSQNRSLLQSALTGNKNGQQEAAYALSDNNSAIIGQPEGIASKLQKPPLKTGITTKNTSPGESSVNTQEQIVERAKQEAYVMQRIGELQKDGLWAERRLPKVHELPRTKAHWDYLLEEMAWLAADFAQERKWKKAAAKKCARMVQKHFQEKEALAQKAIKAKEMQLKRIASFLAREVKQFWSNVEKLVEFKQQTRLEEKRKKALDQHLSFIVDQTEKYSSLVAESMNTSKPTPPPNHSDGEFEPEGSSDDDEETIAKEEALSAKDRKSNEQEEIDALKRESELPLEDLVSDYLAQRDSIGSPLSNIDEGEDEEEIADDNDDDEYMGSGNDSADDEETILEQENSEGIVDYKQEIDDLKAEGDMSMDQLRAKYGILEPNYKDSLPWNGENESKSLKRKEMIGEEDEEEDDMEETSEDELSEEEIESESEKEDSALKTLLNDLNDSIEKSETDRDKEINDVAAIAQSLQPKGNTLSSTSVVTKVPFLLKHSLREYQHIGLDWLVTMYDRKLNGILADEMGLGKTIQTIALLAHLACEKGNWGPHLIVVPTSVMLNWEMEFKKWCPAFKILTYYGSQKERKLKRSGWTKPNAFHICITSYKLVIQDHQSFRRKKWKYLILDEAQNIKNFKSQRWQLLLNFQTQRRLLLTGTPLQNNLMELWSLMHFLMPNVFESHREFKEWFSNPVTGMIEGSSEYNENIIKRLHKVLRPFLLRRLKCEVETQMPKKYEHIVMCRLSNRQRYLYDDFMSRAKTKETLASGSLLSVINVLMQLRKVCNHPNLFEVRPTVSPFQMEGLVCHVPSLVYSTLEYDPFRHVDLGYLNLRFIDYEKGLLAFVADRCQKYKVLPATVCEVDSAPPDPPPCPKGRVKIHLKKRVLQPNEVAKQMKPVCNYVNNRLRSIYVPTAKVGTSPYIKLEQNAQGITTGGQLTLKFASPGPLSNYFQLLQQAPAGVKALSTLSLATSGKNDSSRITPQFAQLLNTPLGRQLVVSTQPVITPLSTGSTAATGTGQKVTVLSKQGTGVGKFVTPINQLNSSRPVMKVSPLNISSTTVTVVQNNATTTSTVSSNTQTNFSEGRITNGLVSPTSTVSSVAHNSSSEDVTTNGSVLPVVNSLSSPNKIITRLSSSVFKAKDNAMFSSNFELRDEELENLRKVRRREKLESIASINETRCSAYPIYGEDTISSFIINEVPTKQDWKWTGFAHCQMSKLDPKLYWKQCNALSSAIKTIEQRVAELLDIFSRFVLFVPPVSSQKVQLHVPHPPPSKVAAESNRLSIVDSWLRPKLRLFHPIISAMSTQFPDRRLIQYDCGKLQSLDRLLRRLKAGHHRVLIFTQMTRMLDVLEAFLNFHGHIYLRLDGTTKVDQRQLLMERFNADKRIFCFILSTRSGGVGVNLTGADTVIFYDSDWNPTMDAQAQDRCHRIGQTRDVHIYRLVSEKTVEENILRKANQKRMLGDVAIEGGNFTTAYFKSTTIQDLFNVDVLENDASRRMAEVLQHKDSEKNTEEVQTACDEKTALGALEIALAQAEDDSDVAAAKVAKAEAAAELAEFDENIPIDHESSAVPEKSKAEMELDQLMEQLNGVEKYAMRFVEEIEGVWGKEQLAAAEAELEQQKKEWEAGRLAALRGEADGAASEENVHELTYSGFDARNQMWVSDDGLEIMPMWCPPTPPQEEGDIYIDQALNFLYEPTLMQESQLPPVYIKKEKKRSRYEAGLPEGGRTPTKVRQKDDSSLFHAPRSMFDRPSPALLKMRQELKLQKYRGLIRPITPSIGKPVPPVKPMPETEHATDWTVQEDWMILQGIQEYLELPVNLFVLSPAHTPNWDFISDNVNTISRVYKSPKQCRNRYESVIMPREEGRVVFDSPKKQKKAKTINRIPQVVKSGRPLRTAQLFQQDNNFSLTQVFNRGFEAIRSVSNRRAPTVKPLLVDPAMKNPKHAEVVADSHIDYDRPLNPVDVALKRVDRIAKEKLALSSQQAVVSADQQLAVLRLQQQHITAKSSASSSPTITAVVTSQAAVIPPRAVTVQDLAPRTNATTMSQAVQNQMLRSPSTTSLVSVQTSSAPGTPTTPKTAGTKTLSAAQLQIYRQQQAILRQQQQQQLRVLQSRAGTVATQKVSVAVSPNTATQRVQQVKAGGVTRTVSESEMVALLKRQAAVKGTTPGTLTSAQILAQASIQAQQSSASGQVGQVATVVKTPVTGIALPQMKAALTSGLKANTVTPQQIRHLSIQQQLLAQHRKLPQQKITQITQAGTAQVVPHTLFSKAQGGSQQARVIPVSAATQQSLKQAIQVVTATASGNARTVTTIDPSSRTGAQLMGALKAGTSQQQQAILSQVSAVLQGSGVRQPVRIQATSTTPIVAVAVPQSPTVLTLPPQNDPSQ